MRYVRTHDTRISEKILLLEELLEISSPLDEENEPVSGEAQDDPNAEDDDDDDGFDNFETIKLGTNNMSAAETCARLERATQNLVQLELEFYEGADIPTIQVQKLLFSSLSRAYSLITFFLIVREKRSG
jgi:hypothetical protein